MCVVVCNSAARGDIGDASAAAGTAEFKAARVMYVSCAETSCLQRGPHTKGGDRYKSIDARKRLAQVLEAKRFACVGFETDSDAEEEEGRGTSPQPT